MSLERRTSGSCETDAAFSWQSCVSVSHFHVVSGKVALHMGWQL